MRTAKSIASSQRARLHERKMGPEFVVWRNMRQRCLNPNHPSFKNYGGRGITISPRWETFAGFLSDMGRRPSPRHSIERSDNDGSYSPENCTWTTWRNQCSNQRRTKRITFLGLTTTGSAWARAAGISPQALAGRLRAGWPMLIALSAPLTSNYDKPSFRRDRPFPRSSEAAAFWALRPQPQAAASGPAAQ